MKHKIEKGESFDSPFFYFKIVPSYKMKQIIKQN